MVTVQGIDRLKGSKTGNTLGNVEAKDNVELKKIVFVVGIKRSGKTQDYNSWNLPDLRICWMQAEE